MLQMVIKVSGLGDIQAVVEASTKRAGNITLADNHHTVNAKVLRELLSVDPKESLILTCDDDDDYEPMKEAMKGANLFVGALYNIYEGTPEAEVFQKMFRPKLFLDFDGVIGDTVKAACQMYNEDYAFHDDFVGVEPEQIDTWDFKELTLAKKKEFYRYFNTRRFFDLLEPMPGAIETIQGVSDLFNIDICTIGTKENLRGKEFWLMQHVNAGYGFIGLTDVHDKSSVDMSGGIFVDDKADNLRSSNASLKICFGQEHEWNRDWDGIRCRSWKELGEFLDNLFKRN